MNSSNRLGDRDRFEAGEHMLDERMSPRPLGSRRAVDAVQQLADRDDADRPLLVRLEGVERARAPLLSDEDVGVDQDGQGLSTEPSSARTARTSLAKLSSTGGAPSISSR